jgi:hypothetical protein
MKPVVSSLLQRFTRWHLGPSRCAAFVCLILCSASNCPATTITFTESGTSAAGTPLLVSATLATAADAGGANNALKITLRSYGAPTTFRADVLSSFYFNIADPNDGLRPTLTYVSGIGSAYEVYAAASDVPVSWTPDLVLGSGTWTTPSSNPSNLVATLDFNEGWQFKTLTPPPTYPGLGFGIGTVGNSSIGTFIPGATGTFDGRVDRLSAICTRLFLHVTADRYAPGTTDAANFCEFMLLPEIPNDLRASMILDLAKSPAPAAKEIVKDKRLARLLLAKL